MIESDSGHYLSELCIQWTVRIIQLSRRPPGTNPVKSYESIIQASSTCLLFRFNWIGSRSFLHFKSQGMGPILSDGISRLSSKRVAFIGLREIDPFESIFIDKLDIPSYSMREVDTLGIREVRVLTTRVMPPVWLFGLSGGSNLPGQVFISWWSDNLVNFIIRQFL